ERGGVRREDRVRSDDLLEVREERLLGTELFHDRLDDELALHKWAQIRGEREPAEGLVSLLSRHTLLVDLALEKVRDPLARRLPERVGDLSSDHLVARLDAELRDPGPHRAETDDAERLNVTS